MSNKSGFVGPVTFAVVGMLLLVPLLYILSAGPMIGLMSRGYISEGATMAVYAPIAFVCESCTPLNDGMGWYVDLFRPADELEIVIDEYPRWEQSAGATQQLPPAAPSGK